VQRVVLDMVVGGDLDMVVGGDWEGIKAR